MASSAANSDPRGRGVAPTGVTRDEDERPLALASTDYAIFMLDATGHVVSCSASGRRIEGYTEHELIGRHFSIFYTQEDIESEKSARLLDTASREGRIEDAGWRVRRDGSRFWANVTITVLHGTTNALVGFAKVTRDMTGHQQPATLECACDLATQIQNVREREQRRISRELHDDLGEHLTAFRMNVAVLEAGLAAEAATSSLRSATRDLVALIDTMAASVRRIASDLRPPMLDDLGLLPALDWLAEDFTRRYGVCVQTHLALGELSFTEFAATAIFRMVQEALTNVARHAKASLVAITAMRMDDTYLVHIEDNGVGAVPKTPGARGALGLLGLRERVRHLGGSISIDSAPGCGFRIEVTLPVSVIEARMPDP
jgi:PAS domain S-box-containing protein